MTATTTPTVEQVQTALAGQLAKLDSLNDFYDSESKVLNDNIAKMRAWLWQHEGHTADSLTEAYISMRDERTVLGEEYKKADDAIKDRMEQHETKLLEIIDSVGGESIRTAHGTAFVQVKTRASCADWPQFWAWIREHDRFDMLEKRVGQKAIGDMLDAGKELPPAINLFRERTVTVRRS